MGGMPILRAGTANKCRASRKPRSADKKVLTLCNEQLRAIYVLQSKSGSSTMRGLFPTNSTRADDWCLTNHPDFTVFTFVRDPLERSISSFFEGWKQHKNDNLSDLDMFKAWIKRLEETPALVGGHYHEQIVPIPIPG